MRANVEVSEDEIENLIVSALEGGSNYWYQIVRQREPRKFLFRSDAKKIFSHIDYPMNPGGSLTIRSTEEPERAARTLSLTTIKRGVKALAASKEYRHHFTDILKEDTDQTTGDVFLQFCLYGEVLYS